MAQIIVADGQRGNAAAVADALLASHNGNLGRQNHIGDCLGVGGSGVVGGDVDDIGVVGSRLCHRGDIVRVGEGVAGNGVALLRQIALNDIALVNRVRLGAAVEQADCLGVREKLLNHGRLLIQRGQIGGAGDVAAYRAGPVADVQRSRIVRD